MKMVFDSMLVLDPFLTRKNRFFIQILTKMTSTENLNHTKIKKFIIQTKMSTGTEIITKDQNIINKYNMQILSHKSYIIYMNYSTIQC